MISDGIEALTGSAGLVLLQPFLPPLFKRLDLVGADHSLPLAHHPKAAQALLHLVFGEAIPVSLPDPLISTLLGAVELQEKGTDTRLAAAELDLVQSMLPAVIAQWGSLGQTSLDGFREAFLQRAGHIRFTNEGAHLSVEAAAYDMLLDTLPWMYSPFKLPWMPSPINVTWRD